MESFGAPQTGQPESMESLGRESLGSDSGAPAAPTPSLPRHTLRAKSRSGSKELKVRLSYEHMAQGVLKENSVSVAKNWHPLRSFLYDIFEGAIHSVFMGIIICLNALLVIHQTDVKAEVGHENLPGWIETASSIFLAIYTIELIVRFWVYRMLFFASWWNIVDLFVVLIDFLAEIAKAGAGGSAPSVSILRIFRLVRLLRLISMLTYFHELQTMLLGFGSAMKAMVWACFMIGVVLTVCSIIAVEFIHPLNVEVAKTGLYDEMGCRRCARAFETVAESNLTFIQQIIAGDSWGKITIPIMEMFPASGVFFLVVFGLIDLGVLNLILTVIVNAAESARETNHEMQLRAKRIQTEEMKSRVKKMCAQLDHDGDGRLSLQEFMLGIDSNESFRKTLALLDIQRQDAEVIYRLMDEDASGDVDYNEFVSTMISTKHESWNTKLLFLKANVKQMTREISLMDSKLNEHVIPNLIDRSDVTDAVRAAVKENSAKMAQKTPPPTTSVSQPDILVDSFVQSLRQHHHGIISEVESLTRNLEQRWEQLRDDQERLLERAISEALVTGQQNGTYYSKSPTQQQEQEQSIIHQASPLSDSMLPTPMTDLHCTPLKIPNKRGYRVLPATQLTAYLSPAPNLLPNGVGSTGAHALPQASANMQPPTLYHQRLRQANSHDLRIKAGASRARAAVRSDSNWQEPNSLRPAELGEC